MPEFWSKFVSVGLLFGFGWYFLAVRSRGQVFAYCWVLAAFLPIVRIPTVAHILYFVAVGWALWFAVAIVEVAPLLLKPAAETVAEIGSARKKRYNFKMRIFYASDKSPNAALQSQLWRNNLLLCCATSATMSSNSNTTWPRHSVTSTPRGRPCLRFIEANRPRVSVALLQQLRAAHAEKPIGLFFSYFYDACVTPETIDAIHALGIVTVNFYCNGSYQRTSSPRFRRTTIGASSLKSSG